MDLVIQEKQSNTKFENFKKIFKKQAKVLGKPWHVKQLEDDYVMLEYYNVIKDRSDDDKREVFNRMRKRRKFPDDVFEFEDMLDGKLSKDEAEIKAHLIWGALENKPESLIDYFQGDVLLFKFSNKLGGIQFLSQSLNINFKSKIIKSWIDDMLIFYANANYSLAELDPSWYTPEKLQSPEHPAKLRFLEGDKRQEIAGQKTTRNIIKDLCSGAGNSIFGK